MLADYAKNEVLIKQLGFHPSRVATKVLQRGDTYILGPMGWFELVDGHYKYHVHFGAKLPHAKSGVESDPEMKCDKSIHDQSHADLDEPPTKKVKLSPDDCVQKTLHSFVDQGSEQSTKELSRCWKEHDALLVFQHGMPINSPKVAAFDLDNTIITTSSGRRFATGPTDWKIMSGVAVKLRSYSEKGYKIVLFSNQLGISKGKPTKEEFKQKVEAIALKLGISFLLMAASAKDQYRKPCTGMWDHLVKVESGAVEIDMMSSFYVGDAAGREVNWLPGISVSTL